LLRGQNQLLVPSGGRKARKTSKISGWGKAPKTLKIFIGILPAVALNRSKAQAKDVRKLH
jgi:hypothetical protein